MEKKEKEKDPWGFHRKGTRESLFASTSAKNTCSVLRDLGACFMCLLSASPLSGSQFPQLAKENLDALSSPQPQECGAKWYSGLGV